MLRDAAPPCATEAAVADSDRIGRNARSWDVVLRWTAPAFGSSNETAGVNATRWVPFGDDRREDDGRFDDAVVVSAATARDGGGGGVALRASCATAAAEGSSSGSVERVVAVTGEGRALEVVERVREGELGRENESDLVLRVNMVDEAEKTVVGDGKG